MRFRDASAVVPLIISEPTSDQMASVLRVDGWMVVWWGTYLECASALFRREREGAVSPAMANQALARLDRLQANWLEVAPAETVRKIAARLLRAHPLRAADALQLAAALAVADGHPPSHPVRLPG